jgi:DNA polymerase elongation subunit (family B)
MIFDGHDDEWNLLRQFWMAYESAGVDDSPTRWGGWNIFNFDLPFLIRRSWKLGVPLPDGVRDRHDRYWGPRWVDLMHRFQAGCRNERFTKLDSASRFFGLGGKTGNGGDFAGLWETDREAAKAYLDNDIRLTREVADRIVGGGGFGLGDELIGARAGLVEDDDDI